MTEGAALEQSLQNAKLSVPEPRPGRVSRRPLIDAARSSGCSVVGVTAPVGYGKSTLLAEWADAEDRPVGFVSLDRLDDDPATLLSVLASAYDRVAPGDSKLIADMSGLGLSVLGRAAPRLASAFAASPTPFVLMLDDLHALESPGCHDVLGIVTAGIPRGSQLVAASRSEQPHLPRLRAAGEVIEFGANDLALDAAGAQQIFAEAEITLAPERAAAVTQRTEGWPVGLYLAALIAKESPDEPFEVTGDDRYVADYLYREALIQLPEQVQRFLCRSAILNELCGPLCDAALEDAEAHTHLRNLAVTNSFLVPLDRRREWYRYHALFREFLLGELRRTEPELMVKLHVRAANWYEANGAPATALEHLLSTTERDRCVQSLTALILPTYNAGQMSTVERWLAVLGDDSIGQHPSLAVLAGWISVLTGQKTDAQRLAAVVEAGSSEGPQLDGSASYESARAMLRAAMCAHGAERMLADATFAVAEEPAWSPWRDTALLLLAEAQLLADDWEQAAVTLVATAAAAAAAGSADAIVCSEAELGMSCMDRGQWDEAADHLDVALTTVDTYRMHDYATSLPAFAGAARLALHRGDPKEAARQLTRAMRARPSCTFAIPWLAVRVRLQLAKVYVAMGDAATARHLVREIDDIFLERPDLGALVEDVSAFRDQLLALAPQGAAGGPPLSAAELRLLPYLQTHLTFPEIGSRLFVSHNTVRSQVGSIYRKLGVSSRSEAVHEATTIGLLGG